MSRQVAVSDATPAGMPAGTSSTEVGSASGGAGGASSGYDGGVSSGGAFGTFAVPPAVGGGKGKRAPMDWRPRPPPKPHLWQRVALVFMPRGAWEAEQHRRKVAAMVERFNRRDFALPPVVVGAGATPAASVGISVVSPELMAVSSLGKASGAATARAAAAIAAGYASGGTVGRTATAATGSSSSSSSGGGAGVADSSGAGGTGLFTGRSGGSGSGSGGRRASDARGVGAQVISASHPASHFEIEVRDATVGSASQRSDLVVGSGSVGVEVLPVDVTLPPPLPPPPISASSPPPGAHHRRHAAATDSPPPPLPLLLSPPPSTNSVPLAHLARVVGGTAESGPAGVARPRWKRAASFAGLTGLQLAMAAQIRMTAAERAQARAAAVVQKREVLRVPRFLSIILLEAILLAAYITYRFAACNDLQWQCGDKNWQQHFDDATSMVTIGGVLFATGPTVTRNHLLPSIIILLVAMFAFGAGGELPFMQNSLVSVAILPPAAAVIYCVIAALAVAMVVYAFRIAPSNYDATVSALVIITLLVGYGSAFLVALASGVPITGVPFHPHHYIIAWSLCLLFRQHDHLPSILIRWMLMGIMVQGLSAYSAASIVSN